MALPNGAEVFQAYLAGMQLGWYVTPLNTHLTAPEMAYVLRDSGASALVAHSRFAGPVSAAAREAGLDASTCLSVGPIDGFTDLERFCEDQPAGRPDDRCAGQMLQYTSGTTGRPKGVRRAMIEMDPDEQAHLYGQQLAKFDITPGGDGVHLCGSPMYHLAALSYAWFSLHYGHTVVVMDGWSAPETLELIETYRVTTTQMVPTQFHRLLQLPEAERARHDLSSLRQVLHAGAPCPVDVKQRMLEWWGPVIYEYYGASEGGGTLVKPLEWLERPGTVGRPWGGGADVRIYDDEGKQLGPGEVGNVYLKLLGDFEYGGDPGKTRAGRIDDYFTARGRRLPRRGRLALPPGPQDRHDHLGRRQHLSGGGRGRPARAPGRRRRRRLRHSRRGLGRAGQGRDRAGPGGTNPGEALAAALTEHCEGRLARYKRPRSFDFVDALPRDPNGKLYKRKLREPYWRERERAI